MNKRDYPKALLGILIMLTLAGFTAAGAVRSPNGPEGSGRQTIVALGDIMLSGSARPVLKKKGYGHAFSSPALAGLMRKADVAVANLEYPITAKGEPCRDKQYVFRGDAESMKAIKDAGIDMLSIANNHVMDYGEKGLASTIRSCNKNRLACSGAGSDVEESRKPGIFRSRGVTYALLSYSMTYPKEYWATPKTAGVAYGDRSAVADGVKKARRKADVVMVSFHWGQELSATPKAYQVSLAHLAIDSGADMVFGHHPHVPQPVEIYRGRPVFYSLGNFAFGSYSRNTAISFAAEMTVDKGRVCRVLLHPVIVDNYAVGFRPEYAPGKQGRDIIEYIGKISEPFGTGIVYKNGAGIVAARASGKQ